MTKRSQDAGYVLRERENREILLGKSMLEHMEIYHVLGILVVCVFENRER